ncbi:MAG: SDR family oxidoreductase [Pyrinomonadaceae bacterium]
MKLKPIEEQVIVITGATSGIGLATARMASRKGARLVLNGRNAGALRVLCNELDPTQTKVVGVPGDVASEADMLQLAAEALNKFGNFDTWVNNAGVSIYGRLEEVRHDDSRQLFETNFWGTVNGSIIAARNLKLNGGAIVNVGSTLSDRAIPIQGMYCASKHAVKGFTDALRMELEAENAPISVSLIKPSAIDTPYKEHAKNYLGVMPENPPPVYAPETVAEAILHCASTPTRDLFVGAGGKAISAMGTWAPRATDLVMESTMIEMQKTDRPGSDEWEGLYQSKDARLRSSGEYDGHVAKSSLYTKASLHPYISGVAIALGIGGLLYALSRGDSDRM